MGDIKVEEVKNGSEPVCTPPSLRVLSTWEHGDPDAETGPDDRNLGNDVTINLI